MSYYLKDRFLPNSSKPVPITVTFFYNNKIGTNPFCSLVTGLTFYQNRELYIFGGRFRKSIKFGSAIKQMAKMHPKGGTHIFLFDENDDKNDFKNNILRIFSGTFPKNDLIWGTKHGNQRYAVTFQDVDDPDFVCYNEICQIFGASSNINY